MVALEEVRKNNIWVTSSNSNTSKPYQISTHQGTIFNLEREEEKFKTCFRSKCTFFMLSR